MAWLTLPSFMSPFGFRLLVILCIGVVHHGNGLKINVLDVPTVTRVGESIEMICSYDMEGENLYSIKWYKNDVEFFRYVPKDWPPGQFLPINGIKIDLQRSNKRSIYLKNVDLYSEGVYRCEVSSEAPGFFTAEVEREMKVYSLPSEGPQIQQIRGGSKPGDIIALNCTSSPSKPASTLQWTINEKLIDPKKVSDEYELTESSQRFKFGVEVTSLTLKFLLKESHFKDGFLRTKCIATIGRMYQMSKELIKTYEKKIVIKSSENLSQVGANGAGNEAGRSKSNWNLEVVLFFCLLLFHSSLKP